MRKLLAGFVLLALSLSAPAAAQAPQEPGWEQLGDEDGIKVSRREVPGSPIIEFKGEGLIDAPPALVASVLLDCSRAPEWIDSLLEAKKVRQVNDLDYVEWDHVGMPLILTDRDFVYLNHVELHPEDRSIDLEVHSVDESAAPVTRFVRGMLIHTAFHLRPAADGSKTYLSGEVQGDPKGWIPKWLVNFFQKDWPRNTFTALRRQINKPGIAVHPALQKMLGSLPR